MGPKVKALVDETESEMRELVEGRRSNRWSGSDMRRMSALVEGVRELDKIANHATEERDAYGKRIDELEAENKALREALDEHAKHMTLARAFAGF